MSYFRHKILDWDSRWFGIPIGRVDLDKLTRPMANKIDTWAFSHGLLCVYVHSDTSHNISIEEFDPVDVRIVYELKFENVPKVKSNNMRLMKTDDFDRMSSLARRIFNMSRFSKDSHFPVERVQELFPQWVKNDHLKGPPGCLILEHGLNIAGFVTGYIDEVDSTKGYIGLLGVSEGQQGKGFGRILLKNICDAFSDLGVKRVIVVTQESNISANRLYAGCGGRIISRSYWYHRWYDV